MQTALPLEKVLAFHIDSLVGLLLNPDLLEISGGLAADLSGPRSDVQTRCPLSLEISLCSLFLTLNYSKILASVSVELTNSCSLGSRDLCRAKK